MSSELATAILDNLSAIIEVDNNTAPLIRGCIDTALAEHCAGTKVKKTRVSKAKAKSTDGVPVAPKPQNGYNYYVRVNMKNNDIISSVASERMRNIAALWRKESDEARDVYLKLAEAHNQYTLEQFNALSGSGSYDEAAVKLDAERHAFQSNPRFAHLASTVGTKPVKKATKAAAAVAAAHPTSDELDDGEDDEEEPVVDVAPVATTVSAVRHRVAPATGVAQVAPVVAPATAPAVVAPQAAAPAASRPRARRPAP